MRSPWGCLAGGITLVDAPGVADDNSARNAVVRQCLASADAVWLVARIVRAVNNKTTKDGMMLADFRHALLDSGHRGQLAFIATQTDALHRTEVIDNLRLDPDSTTKEGAARARNAFTKRRLKSDFHG
jgi:hypothetical protein